MIPSSSVPRFGCRQMAFMTEGPAATAPQQALLKEALLTASNALKAQSQPRIHPDRDGVNVPRHEEDLLRDPQDGNPHGWGMAHFQSGNASVTRSFQPAHTDAAFDAQATQNIGLAPNTLLAHLMHKALPNRPLESVEDLHPFSFQGWASMFNGVVNGGRTPAIVSPLNDTYCPTLATLPKGTNSGEKLLLTFLGQLKQAIGHLSPSVNDVFEAQKAFGKTIDQFQKASTPIYDTLDASVFGVSGQIQWSPSVNYIVSNGQMLMAYRKGRKLYLNRHPALPQTASPTPTAGNANEPAYGYIVASEPFQPSNPNSPKLSWLELPQEHILTLFRKEDGNIDATLTPLSLVKD